MTRSCCPTCRLRFSRATAAHVAACPFCAAPLQALPAVAVLGYKLMALDALLEDEPVGVEALAVSLSLPHPELELHE